MKTKKTALHRSIFRDIRGSFGRFFAIFAIIALGVGFFCGVRITTPVMINTFNEFLQETHFYDYRLVSTLGWEEQDVEEVRKEPGVLRAEGSFSYDVICVSEDGNDKVYKAHLIPEEVNLLRVVEGRLPENADEVLLDNKNRNELKLGDTLQFSDSNPKENRKHFHSDSYTVVGFADSSLYINFERGTTSIGTGEVSGFLYFTKDAFDEEIYTEIYVDLDVEGDIYSDEYDQQMDQIRSGWEQRIKELAKGRHDRIAVDGVKELAEAKAKLAEEKETNGQKLADAKKELDEGKEKLEKSEQELIDGEKKLSDAKTELSESEGKLSDAKTKLEQSKKELDNGKARLERTKKSLDEAKKELDRNEETIIAGKEKLDASKKKLDEGKRKLDAAKQTMEASEKRLKNARETVSTTQKKLNDAAGQLVLMKAALELAKWMTQEEFEKENALYEAARAKYLAGQEQLEKGRREIEEGEAALSKGKEDYQKGLAEYEEGVAKYEEGRKEWEAGNQKFEEAKETWTAGYEAYLEGLEKYQSGLEQYNSGYAEYETGYQKYLDGKKKIEDGEKELEEGREKLENGRKEYEEGLKKYEDGKKEFEEKVAEAEEKIADGEKEIAELKDPDTYLMERNTNIGYSCFENDSDIVAQVAKVFPIFFILVAALVCMTTMTRMVEEQRGQIGILKALGYSNRNIVSKYTTYSGSAALMGCIFGYGTGIFLFPWVIWQSYQLLYIHLPMKFIFDLKLAIIGLIVSILCSVGITLLFCRVELGETAASLMRPKAPKPGKRVFLERFTAIWSRMKFLHKVSVRNIFRYKGRLFMMILGISGSMALLLTGFGIKDSIADFARLQFEEIQIADLAVTFRNGKGDQAPESVQKLLEKDNAQSVLAFNASWDLISGKTVKSVELMVPEKGKDFSTVFRLATTDGVPLSVPGKGEVLICAGLSERFHLNEGDTIRLRNSDYEEVELRISGVFRNHAHNYVIASPEDIENPVNVAYLKYPEGTDVYAAQTRFGESKDVTYVEVYKDFKERVTNMLSSLNYIVLVVIFSAACLAFVVLYNLTNINITERIREIATIKVLGFYRNETAQYVFRENIILTFFGMLIGIGLGILLHDYVMRQIVVDMVYFNRQIKPLSFGLSVILIFAFTFFVNLFMRRKLEAINMAESLKSVE